MTVIVRLTCGAMTFLLASAAAVASAAEPELFSLTLHGALGREHPAVDRWGTTHDRPDLVIDLERQEGRWRPGAWGYARWYNRADHPGAIIETTRDGAGTKFKLQVTIRPDQWIAGGTARCDVVLPEGPAQEGKFAGTFNGRAVAGRAVLAAQPAVIGPIAEDRKFGPGDHPRLLFRKEDLPELRRRARSDVWKDILASLEKDWQRSEAGFGYGSFQGKPQAMEATQGLHAASHAFVFALTGEADRAKRAAELTALAMKSPSAQDELWTYVQKIHGAALAYDLCFEAWEPAFRREVRQWLWRWASQIARPRGLRPQGNLSLAYVNFNPYSSDLALFRAAAGVAALAILGDIEDDQWPAPPAPLEVKADAALAPGTGAPLVRLAHDQVITRWLHATGLIEDPEWRPWLEELQKDPLESVGGSAAARPKAGDRVTYRESTAAFGPLDPQHVFADVYTDHRPAVALLRPHHFKAQSVDYYYAVVENDADRVVRLDLGDRYLWAERLWLNGTPISEHQPLRLSPGRYALLIQARVPTRQTYSPYFPAFFGNSKYAHRDVRRNNWHYNTLVLDDGVIQQYPKGDLWMMPRFVEMLAQAEAKEPRAQAQELAYALPGQFIDPREIAAIAARSLRRYLDSTLGDNGWGPEDECDGDTIQYVFYFLHSHRAAMGAALPAGHPLENFIPLWLARHDQGTEYDRSVFVAAGFAGQRQRGLARHVLDQRIAAWRQGGWMQFPEFAVYALINYPFDTPAATPASLPLTFEDRTAGGYVFRNRWDDGDQQVMVLTRGSAKAHHNAALAGTFTIRGLGTWWSRRWTAGEGVITYPVPGQHNVITMDGALPIDGATVVHRDLRPDGSGSVTYDMSKVYWGAQPRKTNVVKMMDKGGYGSLGLGVDWGDRPPFDAGIRATRTIAVDYSGKCGSPALFVVVDRFEHADGRAKTWRMDVPGAGSRRGDKVLALRDGGAAEAIQRPPGDAKAGAPVAPAGADERALRLTFVAPADAVLKISGSRIEARSEQSHFVAVMTLQKGPAPAVRARGEAPNLRIEVGDQVVRVERDRVIFGQ